MSIHTFTYISTACEHFCHLWLVGITNRIRVQCVVCSAGKLMRRQQIFGGQAVNSDLTALGTRRNELMLSVNPPAV